MRVVWRNISRAIFYLNFARICTWNSTKRFFYLFAGPSSRISRFKQKKLLNYTWNSGDIDQNCRLAFPLLPVDTKCTWLHEFNAVLSNLSSFCANLWNFLQFLGFFGIFRDFNAILWNSLQFFVIFLQNFRFLLTWMGFSVYFVRREFLVTCPSSFKQATTPITAPKIEQNFWLDLKLKMTLRALGHSGLIEPLLVVPGHPRKICCGIIVMWRNFSVFLELSST